MFTKPFYVVTLRELVGRGPDSETLLFMELPGIWSKNEQHAMRFPAKAIAESYARRYRGEVQERTP